MCFPPKNMQNLQCLNFWIYLRKHVIECDDGFTRSSNSDIGPTIYLLQWTYFGINSPILAIVHIGFSTIEMAYLEWNEIDKKIHNEIVFHFVVNEKHIFYIV